ncbi:MAG: glycosyltransferase family 2 protein [Candidatus Glassbacteria bacterium]
MKKARQVKRSISAFFPVFNDWGTIGSLVLSTLNVLDEVSDDYEIILVNDGSDERTREILGKLERSFQPIRVIHHEKNRGYGGALKSGIAHSTKEFIFYTDSDAQYDPAELPHLLDRMEEGVDVVNGYKIKRADPVHRKITGRLYHWIAKLSFGLVIRDVDCDFRLMRRSIFDHVKLESDSGVICVEMIKKIQMAGFKIVEVPVHHYFRLSGKSQFFNFVRVFRVVAGLVRIWWKLVVKRGRD